MQRVMITEFSKGADTTRNPTLLPPGYARVSQNMLHNRENRAELRAGIDRVWATRTINSPIRSLFEFIDNSGTQYNLCQTNEILETFSMTPTVIKTTIGTGHYKYKTRFASFLNFWFEADNWDANYCRIGNGTNSYPLQIIAPTEMLTVTSTSGSGLTAGTYYYSYARYSSITGEISPAYMISTSVVLSGGSLRVNLSGNVPNSDQFDQIRFYRTKVNTTGPFYEHSTINGGAFNVTDSTPDSGLTTLSTIHTSAGASKTSRPEAATDVVIHKGRIHVVGLSGARSRHRWSQPNSIVFDSTTNARHDVDIDDGDNLWRAFSLDGTLVLMKDHSIHLMNGDVDEDSFTWQVANAKNEGIGSYCPFTAAITPKGICFQGEHGIYLYRPGSRAVRISDPIQSTIETLDSNYRLLSVGEYDPVERLYCVFFTPVGETTNTEGWAWSIDTGTWTKLVYAGGKIKVTAAAVFHNSSGRLKLYIGDSNGYCYETNATTGNDGVTSGTETGTVTSGGATTINDTVAAFRTTGNGLLGLSATLQNSTSFEAQEISSNTVTQLTTSAWTTTPSSQTYYVGAIDGILSLGRIDCGNAGYKRFLRINIEFQSQTSTVPMLVGFTLDGDTQPTTSTSFTQVGIFRRSLIVNRIGVGLSPYIRICGTDASLTILKIELDYVDLPGRLP